MQVSLDLSVRATLSVSLRMQQSIRLLQLSSIDFLQEIQAAATNNLFLEDESDVDPTTAELLVAEPVSSPYELGAVSSTRSMSGDGLDDPMSRVAATVDLREHLREQISGSWLDDRTRAVATLVIETLDEDGYLRDSVRDTARALGIADEEISDTELEAAIRLVQELEPAGIGARTVQECLQLQWLMLSESEPGHALAGRLLTQHFELLVRRDFERLRTLSGAEQELCAAIDLIRRLDPRPGHGFALSAADFVVPDVIVVDRDGVLSATVNPALRPRARLNEHYVQLLHASREQNGPGLRQQLQEARWLLRNVEQRFATIQRVADAILRRQRAFFRFGDLALKPLLLREIADEVGIHESTVSRATGNKYMATPQGLFQFKHFFSRELGMDSGGRCSATAVRALIREMIEAEPTHEPLSDVVLADRLSAQGINVARRTVSKYRNMMKLPPVEFRRVAA